MTSLKPALKPTADPAKAALFFSALQAVHIGASLYEPTSLFFDSAIPTSAFSVTEESKAPCKENAENFGRTNPM